MPSAIGEAVKSRYLTIKSFFLSYLFFCPHHSIQNIIIYFHLEILNTIKIKPINTKWVTQKYFVAPFFLPYRCTNSELKYGPAVTCQQCKQRCAFNRPDHKVCVEIKIIKKVLRAREICRTKLFSTCIHYNN